MSDFILKEDGSPFATHTAAKTKATILEKEGTFTKPVEVENGFALEVIKKTKKKRAKLGKRDVLTIKAPDGYRARVVNDVHDRIQRFEDAGWSVYKGDQKLSETMEAGSLGSAVTKPVAPGITGVVMIKPLDEFEEDYNEKQAEIDDWEEKMKLQPKIKGQYGNIRIGRF